MKSTGCSTSCIPGPQAAGIDEDYGDRSRKCREKYEWNVFLLTPYFLLHIATKLFSDSTLHNSRVYFAVYFIGGNPDRFDPGSFLVLFLYSLTLA